MSMYSVSLLTKYQTCVSCLGEKFTRKYWEKLQTISLTEIVNHCLLKGSVRIEGDTEYFIDDNFDSCCDFKHSVRLSYNSRKMEEEINDARLKLQEACQIELTKENKKLVFEEIKEAFAKFLMSASSF